MCWGEGGRGECHRHIFCPCSKFGTVESALGELGVELTVRQCWKKLTRKREVMLRGETGDVDAGWRVHDVCRRVRGPVCSLCSRVRFG